MTYRTDPVWQRAQQALINPEPGSADERLVESLAAAVTMWAVERAGGAA